MELSDQVFIQIQFTENIIMKEILICIITYKRPIGLNRLLKSLAEQKIPPSFQAKIIVVDNACQQEIKNIVCGYKTDKNFLVEYHEEPMKGIVNARNKCVSVFLDSTAEYLLFIDDDEWLKNENWIESMIFAQNKYNCEVVTSHVISVGENGTPEWATNLLYGKNKFNEGQLLNTFYTNNVLIVRNVLENIQPAFDGRFALTGASDYHFSLKCRRKGYKIVYTNAPVIEEFPKSRATIQWFVKRGYRSGIGYTRSHLFEDHFLAAVIHCSSMALLRLLMGIKNLVIGTVLLKKQAFIEGLFRISSSLGSIIGFFGITYNEYDVIHGQ